ncbi:MAG: ABC transporter permease [Asgard group archaeon]|nr:ABC transporter permease [Asgard group archaeon]
MKPRRILTIVKMEMTRQVMDPLVLIFTILLVPILILVFGLAMGNNYGWDETSTYSIFDIMFPGFLAYGSLLTIYDVASSVAGERELGLQKRINTTPLTTAEYILSQMISYTIKPLIQILLGFGIALLIGYHGIISFPRIMIMILFLVMLTFCSVGFGLITSTFAKTANAAGGLAFIFIVPQQIFATFIPPVILGADSFKWIFPSFYAMDGIGYTFTSETLSISYIWRDVGILFAISIAIYVIGIFLYERKKRR